MTREGVGMGEGFGAEKISPVDPGAKSGPQGRRPYLVLLLLVDLEDQGKERVKPAVQAELARVELVESEVKPFMQEAAGWAQSGLKTRAGLEGKAPSA